jgi:uncharacterized PurR-regulated membrane protein YhhQ (DUF165 family)
MNRVRIVAVVAAYLSVIVAANWAVERFGAVPVGFGLIAPAGVWFAGLAFTLRDLVQAAAGRLAVFVAILLGAALSFVIANPALAVASAAAFSLSELADFAIYDPLHRRGWLTAVAASNAVGLVVDSAVFLWLAFGSFQFLAGQIVGKAWMTLAAVLVLTVARTIVRRYRRKETVWTST